MSPSTSSNRAKVEAFRVGLRLILSKEGSNNLTKILRLNYLLIMIPKCYFPFFRAHEICVKRDLLRAKAFILGRMGTLKQALSIIIDKMDDMEEVLAFTLELSFSEFSGCIINNKLNCLSGPQSLFNKDGVPLKKPFSSAIVASMEFPSLTTHINNSNLQMQEPTSASFVEAYRKLNHLHPWADKSLI